MKSMTRPMNVQTLGLKAAAQQSELSRAEISKRVGVDPSTLSKYLRGSLAPSPERAETIAAVCGLGSWARVLDLGEVMLIEQERGKIEVAARRMRTEPALEAVLEALGHLTAADLLEVEAEVARRLGR